MGIDRYNNTKSEIQKRLRLYGGTNPTSKKKQQASIPKKWHFLVNSNFKFSERCCYHLKKQPLKQIKKTFGYPFIGTRASESDIRIMSYLKKGCNSFKDGNEQSTPLMFWDDKDIDQYIQKNNIELSSIYETEKRTGCMFCMFGIQFDKNRFERIKKTHPKQYNYYMNELKIKDVIKFLFSK